MKDWLKLQKDMEALGWSTENRSNSLRYYRFHGTDDLENPVWFSVREHPQGGLLIYLGVKMEKTLLGPLMFGTLEVLRQFDKEEQ